MKTPEGFLDMMGEPLYTGDYVILPHPDYRLLQIGQIVGWTAKKVRVKFIIENSSWGSIKPSVMLPESRKFVKTTEYFFSMAKLKWNN